MNRQAASVNFAIPDVSQPQPLDRCRVRAFLCISDFERGDRRREVFLSDVQIATAPVGVRPIRIDGKRLLIIRLRLNVQGAALRLVEIGCQISACLGQCALIGVPCRPQLLVEACGGYDQDEGQTNRQPRGQIANMPAGVVLGPVGQRHATGPGSVSQKAKQDRHQPQGFHVLTAVEQTMNEHGGDAQPGGVEDAAWYGGDHAPDEAIEQSYQRRRQQQTR